MTVIINPTPQTAHSCASERVRVFRSPRAKLAVIDPPARIRKRTRSTTVSQGCHFPDQVRVSRFWVMRDNVGSKLSWIENLCIGGRDGFEPGREEDHGKRVLNPTPPPITHTRRQGNVPSIIGSCECAHYMAVELLLRS